jgi:membrane protease YdiL (CAAX protease family)
VRILAAGTQFCPGCGHTLAAWMPAPARKDARVSSARFAEHWEELKRVGWLFGLLLGSSFVLGLASRSDSSPWPMVILSVIDAAIVIVAVGLRYRSLFFLFKVHPIGPSGWTALVAMAFLLVGGASLYFWALQHLGVPMSSSTDAFTRAGWPVWTMLVLMSAMPAVFEELAFRGVMQSSLERVFNARDAWLIQAALFSVLHLSPLAFPSHFLMGLCLGYMRRRSRSIYPGMLLHACWNALAVLQDLTA